MADNVRQNYAASSEEGVNKQINLEFYAMYSYLSMANYFERHDVALHGFAKYFRKAGHEELEHAEKLQKFQIQRGGRVVLQDIKKPSKDDWEGPLEAMEAALALERMVNQALLDLHKIADDNGDFQMSDFIEGNYLHEQVEAIKEISDHITNIKRVGTGHGIYHFDKCLGE
uniref:Ferritin n=1 Tax=Suberites domuncula TaxID=55567 RepID=Q8T312_SUBDO|nr:Ferritin type 2 [Suberites domuncula]